MAWTYSDWVTLTSKSSRLTRLRLHIQEVVDELSASVSADGVSFNPSPLTNYLKMLEAKETALQRGGKMAVRSRIKGLGC